MNRPNADAKSQSLLSVSSAPGQGIALVLISGLAFTLNDTIMKWLRTDYPVGELVCLRGLFSIAALLAIVPFIGGWRTLRVKAWGAQFLRGLLAILTTLCFIGALRYMPLADAIGIAFAGPLFTVALAGPLLGEKVGWRRWSAVGVGFIGLLLMVKPTGAGFQLAALLPLATALGGSLRDILTRHMSVTDHSNATLAFSVIAVTLAGGMTLPAGWLFPHWAWSMPTLAHTGLFAVAGILLGIGQYCLIESLRVAQVGLVAPFKYMSYVWALGLGVLLFGDLPSIASLLGVTIVAGSGLFIFWRERQLASR